MITNTLRASLSSSKQRGLLQLSSLLFSSNNTLTSGDKDEIIYGDEVSKHRMKLPLYDLEPRTENNWIAPNSTISILLLLLTYIE
jgi:hypothetical protein